MRYPYCPRDSQESSPVPQFKSISSLMLSFLYGLEVQLSHPYTTTGKTIALTIWTFVSKVTSLLFNVLSVLCLVTQSCPTLYDPRGCSPPGSSVGEILQARILKCVAIPFSRGIFPTQRQNPGLPHCRQILYCLSHPEEASVPANSYCYFTIKSVPV